jgi:glycosyltransferase involved in cell wall biosynthesis
MQSVRMHHPHVDRYIVLSDSYREFPDIDLAATLVACDDLGITEIKGMKLWYSVIEFNTAVKPFAFMHLFSEFGYQKLCYLDPDILLFNPLTTVFKALTTHNIVLTPHMMAPLQDGKEPSDLTIMKSGVYNLGFLGVRRDPQSMSLLKWWSDRLTFHCRVDIPGNMFTDQRWMDLAPVLVPNPFILRHPGYNVAYWNIAHRLVSKNHASEWIVDGKPLVFFHFSGIKPDERLTFSKHQNRFDQSNLGLIQELCDLYRDMVLSNHWKKYSNIRYAFGFFRDGRPIENIMRRWLVRTLEQGLLSKDSLATLDSEFFDQEEEDVFEHSIKLTRSTYQLWLDRNDLQKAFNVHTADGCKAYVAWLLEGDAKRQGVDGRTIYAVGRLSNFAFQLTAFSARLAPPWPAAAMDSWRSSSITVDKFIARDVLVPRTDVHDWVLPLEAALLWESRLDLQRHFPFKKEEELDDYLGWILTSGVSEGSIHPHKFTAKFLAQLDRLTSLSSFYDDIPLTTGLIITRFMSQQRLKIGQRFPVEYESRLSQCFWYAYLAPKEMRWPLGMVKVARGYLEQPSGLYCEALELSRAAVAPWEFRQDLQAAFPKASPGSIYSYLHWLIVHGEAELGLSLDEYALAVYEYLVSSNVDLPPLTHFATVAYHARSDLQQLFDLSSSESRAAYAAWFDTNCEEDYPHVKIELLRGRRTRKLTSRKASPAVKRAPIINARVALTGQWFAKSGRGEDVRCSASSLLAIGYNDFVIIDRDTGKLLTSDFQLIDPSVSVMVEVNIFHMNAETALIDWQRIRELKVSAKKNVGFWAWELETLPSYWRYCYSFYDEIWASTEFARQAFEREKLRPVRLTPMAVMTPTSERVVTRRELDLPEDTFIFFFMFDFRSFLVRKNPEAAIRAFQKAFPKGDEKVLLLIKTQGGDLNPDQWFRFTKTLEDPRISIRDVVLDRNEVVDLLRASDSFVSLHRSEGFGRGPAEAMLLQKPTIVTAYSGTEDFTDSSCAYPVDFDLVPVAVDEYPGVDGQRWANASVDHAATQMRRVYEKPEEARLIGERAREKIVDLYSPSVVGKKMLEAILALGEESKTSLRSQQEVVR